MKLFLYNGAGNRFRIIDGRRDFPREMLREPQGITALCSLSDGITDGLIILSESDEESCDFRMDFFNPDGSGGMMCGNGGRCIASFARDMGIAPSVSEDTYRFQAADGIHTARIIEDNGERKTVSLSMSDVSLIERIDELDGWFLNTGTRHFVRFIASAEALEKLNIGSEAPAIRYDTHFLPEGANVNYVVRDGRNLRIRTYEKGVEGETPACGTGIVAAAIVAAVADFCLPDVPLSYGVRSRGGNLNVGFRLSMDRKSATEIILTGPTVCEIQ